MLTEEFIQRYEARCGRAAPTPAQEKVVARPKPNRGRGRPRRTYPTDEHTVETLRQVAEHEYGHEKNSGRYILLMHAAHRIETLAIRSGMARKKWKTAASS